MSFDLGGLSGAGLIFLVWVLCLSSAYLGVGFAFGCFWGLGFSVLH